MQTETYTDMRKPQEGANAHPHVQRHMRMQMWQDSILLRAYFDGTMDLHQFGQTATLEVQVPAVPATCMHSWKSYRINPNHTISCVLQLNSDNACPALAVFRAEILNRLLC